MIRLYRPYKTPVAVPTSYIMSRVRFLENSDRRAGVHAKQHVGSVETLTAGLISVSCTWRHHLRLRHNCRFRSNLARMASSIGSQIYCVLCSVENPVDSVFLLLASSIFREEILKNAEGALLSADLKKHFSTAQPSAPVMTCFSGRSSLEKNHDQLCHLAWCNPRYWFQGTILHFATVESP